MYPATPWHYFVILSKDLAFFPTDTCSFTFIAALDTIARKWKQPMYPSAEE